MPNDKKALLLRIPAGLQESLSYLAEKKGMTMTGLITSILWEYVQKEDRAWTLWEQKRNEK